MPNNKSIVTLSVRSRCWHVSEAGYYCTGHYTSRAANIHNGPFYAKSSSHSVPTLMTDCYLEYVFQITCRNFSDHNHNPSTPKFLENPPVTLCELFW